MVYMVFHCADQLSELYTGQVGATMLDFRDWSLIMGRRGLQNGKVAGP